MLLCIGYDTPQILPLFEVLRVFIAQCYQENVECHVKHGTQEKTGGHVNDTQTEQGVIRPDKNHRFFNAFAALFQEVVKRRGIDEPKTTLEKSEQKKYDINKEKPVIGDNFCHGL